jgi:hypothetical protein
MAIGFVAFPTRVFAEYVGDESQRHAAAIFYVASLFAVSLTWTIKWITGIRTCVLDRRLDPAYIRRLTIKYGLSCATLALATIVAVFNWSVGLAIAAAVTLLYLRTPERPRFRPEEAKPHTTVHPVRQAT